MKIHLFRSDDCDSGLLHQVASLLNNYPGPLKFVEEKEARTFRTFQKAPEDPYIKNVEVISMMKSSASPMEFEQRHRKRKSIQWKNIFDLCANLRQQHDIGKDDYVVLLMNYNNDQNWFAAGSPDKHRNFFVHTADWDFFIGSDQRFPVAYQVASGILKKLVFPDPSELQQHWHAIPRACMLDFCEEKLQVSLKMRSADICPDCLRLFEKRKLSVVILKQVLSIFEGIREQMLFKSRFRIEGAIPALHIQGRNYDFLVPEMGQLSIQLDPLEKTLYLFYLQHPEGVAINYLSEHTDDLMYWYSRVSSSENRTAMVQSIRELSNPLSNSASEKFSRIKKKFIHAFGPDIAKHFLISGGKGKPRKISLHRKLVVFQDN